MQPIGHKERCVVSELKQHRPCIRRCIQIHRRLTKWMYCRASATWQIPLATSASVARNDAICGVWWAFIGGG